jgi:hypothetical protein
MDNIRFYAILAGFSIIAIGITFLIAKFTKKNSLKFLPAVVFALAAVGCFIKSAYFSESFQDLAFMLMGIMATVLFALSLITAMLMGKNKKAK